MLQLELIPGKALGDFVLGMPISEAIAAIQQNMDVISLVELKFNENDPLSMDIVVDLTEDGVLLRFEPISQRLRMIEVYEVPKIKLSYSGSVFSSLDTQPTFVLVYTRLGPTYPGEYDANKHVYHLHYPGLSFTFPIPARFHTLYADNNDLPVEFPDGTTPITSRIFLYSGHDPQNPALQTLSPSSLYFEDVLVRVGESISFARRGCSINFDSTTQDILSELGMPSRIFYKEEDKMRIHSSTPYTQKLGECADYFYNYFSLGIDILFDHHKHTVKKVILHTNFPTHQEFNQYVKCNFKIVVPSSNPPPTSTQLSSDTENTNVSVNLLNRPAESEIAPLANATQSAVYITADMKWDTIVSLYSNGKSGKPVINNRGSTQNPFGATYFYGFKDVIFEVMRNGYIASVCLFSSARK
eukprot:TRINITY_DN4120_c0_g1_i4.p1 TRINITY_DN4120_c0_g1~~TRINITY_DN4120_c0_g1_i4.p1  ORF type:complete len:413 (+),score=74.42 TRINITY_DN4120_c0_g1_i4:749-1987(+)